MKLVGNGQLMTLNDVKWSINDDNEVIIQSMTMNDEWYQC